MKFQVQFKDPDTLTDSIRDAVKQELDGTPGLSQDEKDLLIDGRCEKVSDAVSKWFKWAEYVLIECDTDAGTAVVIEEKR